MSSRQECFRKEHAAVTVLLDNVRLAAADLAEAGAILELLAQQDAADSSVESEALAKLTEGRQKFERIVTKLSALIGNVWEARSPNEGIFAQEVAAWQRTHPDNEWYQKDIEKF